jgi:hypothetical protein
MATRRDKELEALGCLDAERQKSGSVGDVIDDYLKSTGGDIGRTKSQVLRKIREEFAIIDIPCDELRPRDITDFASTMPKGRSASTVQNYLSHLSAVLSIARTSWDYDMNRDVAQDRITAARHRPKESVKVGAKAFHHKLLISHAAMDQRGWCE